MSVLSLLKKVKVQTLSFEKHPCKDLDQEDMVHYLNGLALITNEDENVCEKEREYLEIIINSFGLSEDMLETFVNFAENPDEKRILKMMQSFATKDIKYNFMVDCMMIASIDGEFDDSEEAIIEQYFEMFKITKNEAKDLRYIYEMFYTQNGNALYRYFKRNEYMKVELFQYLLDYYKIDMAYELVEDEKKILSFEFFKPVLTQGYLGYSATQIMTKPVSNIQFCIFLNYANIRVNDNVKVFSKKDGALIMNLNNSDIEFIDNIFFISDVKKESKKVTGVTTYVSDLFIKWISNLHKTSYHLTAFKGTSSRHKFLGNHNEDDEYINLEGFKNNPIVDEFFIYETYGRYLTCPSNEKSEFEMKYLSVIQENYNSKKTSFRLMKNGE